MPISARIASLIVTLCLARGALGGPLPTDPQAFLRGTQAYSSAVLNLLLQANVDYAVYAPGQFSNSAALGFPADPSGGANFVYAYQILNAASSPSDPAGTKRQSVINLNVGFSEGTELPANIGALGAGFGQLPSTFQFIPAGNPKTAAKWDYSAANVLAVGANSTILLYTSPKGPEFDNASIQGGSSLGDQKLLPSPIPEPATLALLIIGGAVLLLSRSRRINNVLTG